MFKLKRPSIHPKFAAAVDAVVGLLLIWLAMGIGSWLTLGTWFLTRLIWLGFLVFVAYAPASISRLRQFILLAVFHFGGALFLFFIDWPPAWYLAGGWLVFAPALCFWLVPSKESELAFELKPLRRWKLLMIAYAVAGLWSAVFAGMVFQIFSAWNFWLPLGAAVITAVLSAWWWREYGLAVDKRFWAALATLTICVGELGIALVFLPLGFFASAALMVWVWYLLWLTLRFYLSPEGLKLKKQLPFLIINAVLLLVYLSLVIRWR